MLDLRKGLLNEYWRVIIDTYLVVTGLGPARQTLASDITKITSQCGCSVTDMRFNKLGMDVAFTMLLAGHWSAIAKVETQLQNLAKKNLCQIQLKRTKLPKHKAPLLPYLITAIGLDAPDALLHIMQFFTHQGIQVHTITSNTYLTQYTATQMFNLEMVVHIPGDMPIAEINEQFMVLSEELNYDSLMEPEKGA